MAAPVGHPREAEEAASSQLVGVRLDFTMVALLFSLPSHFLSGCTLLSALVVSLVKTQLCFLEVEILSVLAAPRIPPEKRIFTTTHTPNCLFQDVDER